MLLKILINVFKTILFVMPTSFVYSINISYLYILIIKEKLLLSLTQEYPPVCIRLSWDPFGLPFLFFVDSFGLIFAFWFIFC